MTSPIVVFLGPSLPRDEVPAGLDGIYYPPVTQGDLVRAVSDIDPGMIVIIDGIFAQAPAVRHKEILWALSRGIHIYGAASMGAVRAAELHPFGMRGHGLIYRWYRATLLADDDEVAVATMPPELGSQALGEALIDIRLTLRKAERCGIIPVAVRKALVDVARNLHFIERTYPQLLDRAGYLSTCDPALLERLRCWIDNHACYQKREDALGLLNHVAALQAAGSQEGKPPSVDFRMTEALAADLAAAAITTPDIL
jgi:hypothetical protein